MSTAISFSAPPSTDFLPDAAKPQRKMRASLALTKTLGTPKNFNQRPNKIAFPTIEGLSFEKIKHITFLEASGNYTLLHFQDGRQVLVSKTLSDVEMMLPEAVFIRIHRSHTVHIKHLKKYVRGKGGYVILQNGTTLTVSTGQKEAFLEAVKNFFG